MKYLCYYDVKDNQEKRKYILSATNKIDYILKALRKVTEEEIEIISASTTQGTTYFGGRTELIGDRIKLRLFPTFGRKNIVTKLLDRFIQFWGLLFFLFFYVRTNETVIVYHSCSYINVLRILKCIKRFKMILELEEIYADVTNDSKQRKKEDVIISLADAYIFPTQLLDEKVNVCHKPAVIIHGTYQVEKKRDVDCFVVENKDKEIIHCVYAGTLDPRKGGAIAAAMAASYLSEEYHMHILGFGNDKEVESVQEAIAEISASSKATVSFDGLLSGEEYTRFIQSCQIGLSTQNPAASFNDTSFPSKILSYLANGLHVVSIRIPAIEKSRIGDILSYYDSQTPQEIAKAIMSVDLTEMYDSRALIAKLSIDFIDELKVLFDNLDRRKA